ncbi:hypothetical protein ANO14919_011510 [Xylariales sp. No.14919]|nr:hypothetical protein ANO14919_011510 [Xylariales sp. No.14919]
MLLFDGSVPYAPSLKNFHIAVPHTGSIFTAKARECNAALN